MFNCCYRTNLTSGNITINGRPRDLKLFRSQAAYIMQDDLLQTHITVYEAMHFSVNLKIGNQLKHSEKKERVSFSFVIHGKYSDLQYCSIENYIRFHCFFLFRLRKYLKQSDC